MVDIEHLEQIAQASADTAGGVFDLSAKSVLELIAEVRSLRALISTPKTEDFIEAIKIEAAHQIKRSGVEHDGGKTDADWFWLVGYLAGKAIHKPEKKLHHIITTAAACLNWHRNATGESTAMRPGIAPPDGVTASQPANMNMEFEAARDMEAECTLGAGSGFGKYTREMSERRGVRMISDKQIDRICFQIGNTHDTSQLWGHMRDDPDAFRAAVRFAMAEEEEAPGLTENAYHDAPRAEVDRVARLLIAEWERIEKKPVNVSYVANFADMARVVIADKASNP